MLHHISIAAENPLQVARVLSELLDGSFGPFPPHPGSYFVAALDQYGTAIEVYPLGTELLPGVQEVDFVQNPFASALTATHVAISVPVSQQKIEAVAAREGWMAMRCDRGGFFEVIELWIENQMLIELLPPELAAQYLSFMQPESLQAFFQTPTPVPAAVG